MTDTRLDTVNAIRVHLEVPDPTLWVLSAVVETFGDLISDVAYAAVRTPGGEQYVQKEVEHVQSLSYTNPIEIVFTVGAATAGIYKLLVLIRDWKAEQGIKTAERDRKHIENLHLFGETSSRRLYNETVLNEVARHLVSRIKLDTGGVPAEIVERVGGSASLAPVALSLEAVEPVVVAD